MINDCPCSVSVAAGTATIELALTMIKGLVIGIGLATPIGFLAVVSPDGLGVREAVVFVLLRGGLGSNATTAAMGTFMLRLVWLMTDVVIAGLFFVASNRFSQKSGAQGQSS